MSIVVVGSIGFDTIKTPFANRKKSLGGAANYFAMSAKFFSKILMVGAIGEDFPLGHIGYLKNCGIDIKGITTMSGSTFHWEGEYSFELSEAKTIKTELNVYEKFNPVLPEHYKNASTIFLANIDPDLQIKVLEQMQKPNISALDTMNFWIENKKDTLIKAISLVDILFINDAEIRELTQEHNIVKASKKVLKMGARIVVVKRGEYGAFLSFDNHFAFMPAFPLEDVFDPTGAGDSFAGGFLGYLSKVKNITPYHLKMAMLFGTVMSSFVIEKFSFDRIQELDNSQIEMRKNKLCKMISLMEIG